MSPQKKSKRPQAAQQLIENLLDETPNVSSASASAMPLEPASDDMNMFEGTGSFAELAIDDGDKASQPHAHVPKFEKPPFEGTSPVVTQMVQRTKIVRPSPEKIRRESPPSRAPDVDFSQMSAEDPYDAKLEVISGTGDENTVRVQVGGLSEKPRSPSEPVSISSAMDGDIDRGIDRGGATEIRSSVKIPPSPKFYHAGSGGAPSTSFEASLKQAESLRIAQSRITELEQELERVRRDNESLSTAGDTLRRRTDELTSKAENFELQAREANLRLDEEKKVLRGQLQQKDRDNAEMKARVEEIETRLESNFKKIRVRERELEHRLEIVKMESATLVSTKDKMLLDLKRQIDQLHHESDSAQNKSQELFGQYKEKQDTIRRVVRALRIALTILEGDDETVVPFRKAE